MDCLDDTCEIMGLKHTKNAQILSHPPMQYHIKILLLVYKIYLFYGSKQKIEIYIIFIYIKASIPSHINGLPVFQVITYFILDINGLELLQNNINGLELLQNIKYYLFYQILVNQHGHHHLILHCQF